MKWGDYPGINIFNRATMKPFNFLKILLTVLGLVLPIFLRCQININAQLPTGGMLQKEQLWNLGLVSSEPGNLEVTIKLSLQDAASNQELLTASSGPVLLSQGVKFLTSQSIQPIIYYYAHPEFSGNFLPIGNYNACYQVLGGVGDGKGLLASECIRFTIEPLSPPVLNEPADKSQVNSAYPFFVWMPPAPIDMFSNLSYDLIVAEVIGEQSAPDAIKNNIPVYANNNIKQTNLNYPISFTRLDTGKTYAWQVVAKNGNNYEAKTEVWTFTIPGLETTKITPVNINYLLLENELKGTYYINGSRLYIKYTSFDMGYNATINFLDAGGNVVDNFKKNILPGDNYIDLTLSRKLKKETVYSVSITDNSGKSHTISISINK